MEENCNSKRMEYTGDGGSMEEVEIAGACRRAEVAGGQSRVEIAGAWRRDEMSEGYNMVEIM